MSWLKRLGSGTSTSSFLEGVNFLLELGDVDAMAHSVAVGAFVDAFSAKVDELNVVVA